MNTINYFEFPEGAQAKQHINLSQRTWNIIEQDIIEFSKGGKNSTVSNESSTIKISGFINHILEIYLREGLFPADITSIISEKEEAIRMQLATVPHLDNAQIDQIVELLLKDYTNSLLAKYQLPKGEGRKFDVNQTCRFLLAQKGTQGLELPIFQKRGRYINAILEEYASLPGAEREEIYFSNRCKEIELSIRKKERINIITTTTWSGLIPYKIMRDKYNMHSYLVAFSTPDTNTCQSTVFRISKIKDLSRTSSATITLTKEQQDFLEEEIRIKGIQYLPGDTDEIRVQLTPAGESMYHRVTYQRPTHIKQTKEDAEKRIYTFFCTFYQAKIYFSNFGKEAIILSPKTLREEIHNFHKEAALSYEQL